MAKMPLPHSMTVTRLSASGTNKELYGAVGTAIACWVQPADSEMMEAQGATFSKTFRCFVDYAANVKVKDRVTIGGNVYNVQGERTHQYGTWPHRVLTLELI